MPQEPRSGAPRYPSTGQNDSGRPAGLSRVPLTSRESPADALSPAWAKDPRAEGCSGGGGLSAKPDARFLVGQIDLIGGPGAGGGRAARYRGKCRAVKSDRLLARRCQGNAVGLEDPDQRPGRER